MCVNDDVCAHVWMLDRQGFIDGLFGLVDDDELAGCLMRKCETGKQQKRIGMRCETYIEEKTRVTKRVSCWVWFHYICLPDGNRRSRQWRWDLIEIEWRVATDQRRKGQQSSLGILVGRSVGRIGPPLSLLVFGWLVARRASGSNSRYRFASR